MIIDPTWKIIIKEIDNYIITYFQKIEWYYGENRAPFAYPARCYIDRTSANEPLYSKEPLYVCELVMEDPGAINIKISAETPSQLLPKVIKTINSQFHNFEDDNE